MLPMAGLLECFCVPWMPSMQTISALSSVRPVRLLAQRFARRHFAPLAHAPKAQGRTGQAWRLLMRASGAARPVLSGPGPLARGQAVQSGGAQTVAPTAAPAAHY